MEHGIVQDALAKVLGKENSAGFNSQLRRLRDAGSPPIGGQGRGIWVDYTFGDVVETYCAVRLVNDVGLTPSVAATYAKQAREAIEKTPRPLPSDTILFIQMHSTGSDRLAAFWVTTQNWVETHLTEQSTDRAELARKYGIPEESITSATVLIMPIGADIAQLEQELRATAL